MLNQSHRLSTLHPSGWKPFLLTPVDNHLRSRVCAARDIREHQPLSRVSTVFPPDSNSYIKKKKKLEYNCFSMLCYFLLYNKVDQLKVILPLEPPSRPTLKVITEPQTELLVLYRSFPLDSL